MISRQNESNVRIFDIRYHVVKVRLTPRIISHPSSIPNVMQLFHAQQQRARLCVHKYGEHAAEWPSRAEISEMPDIDHDFVLGFAFLSFLVIDRFR